MITTKTGGLTVGFREVRVLSKDFSNEVMWARDNGFGCIDLVNDVERKIPVVLDHGVKVGSIDLPARHEMLSPDRDVRKTAARDCIGFMNACAKAIRSRSADNPLVFWVMMLPADPSRPRKENYGYMLESYRELGDVVSKLDARIVIEGWPGPGCVVCTPEGYRSFLRDCQCDSIGVNYDPSHLIRMGIDPLRFLHEFCTRTYHIHAKDTEILDEKLFEYGHELPAIFEKSIASGGNTWRYTIPGHGEMRWKEGFRILNGCGFGGLVSIELEDANFNTGDGDGEKEGLALGGAFLAGC